jgi:predicted site-specific integrase-resolvase
MSAQSENSEKQQANFVSPGVASRMLCAHTNTLRRWAKQGALKFYVTPTGQYRYDAAEYLARWGIKAA